MLITNLPSASACMSISWVLVMFLIKSEKCGTVVQISNVTLAWKISDF